MKFSDLKDQYEVIIVQGSTFFASSYQGRTRRLKWVDYINDVSWHTLFTELISDFRYWKVCVARKFKKKRSSVSIQIHNRYISITESSGLSGYGLQLIFFASTTQAKWSRITKNLDTQSSLALTGTPIRVAHLRPKKGGLFQVSSRKKIG